MPIVAAEDVDDDKKYYGRAWLGQEEDILRVFLAENILELEGKERFPQNPEPKNI